ncbi:carbohydrate kinase [Luteitalea sp. TBR-22]|uniref:rhamnulokinase n=1 Tax=Luteitalea sp. TBR-22 TaxID=2802971 RepID=UPI001AF48E81|nr:rhamnulokinase family protein [Luteitalea sp. TBR-22]BCS32314.1 carbohydrate kinase [Luteitalea sp. TBR-22]
MPATWRIAAGDLGATSGRVMRADVDTAAGTLALAEVHRFPTPTVTDGTRLHWDAPRLLDEVLAGLTRASAHGRLDSLGLDTWGVDYGLVDETGDLLGLPFHYRDARTDGVMADVLARLGRERLYDRTGIQFLPFNTLYQLVAEHRDAPDRLARAATLLTMPDLLHFWLTGTRGVEFTNATTTQMLDWRTGGWATDVLDELDLPTHVLPAIVAPGTQLGLPTAATVARAPALAGVPVVAPACHDTGSAVASIQSGAGVAFLSSGTWSLLGTESPTPVVSRASLAHNFTNEGGVAGTTRVLRNITGLWILEGCLRGWRDDGQAFAVDQLLAAAAQRPACRALIDPDDAAFHRAPDAAAVQAWCARTGQPVPESASDVARVVLDSLALACRRVVRALELVTGVPVHTIRIIGGGARNRLLNQATADATGCRVLAGPVEATALGNVAVQLVTLGACRTLADARALVASAFPPEEFAPRATQVWDQAAERFGNLKLET